MNIFELYKTDFCALTQEQVNLIRTQQWDTLDIIS